MATTLGNISARSSRSTRVSRFSFTTPAGIASSAGEERSRFDGTAPLKIFPRESMRWGFARSMIRSRPPPSRRSQPKSPWTSKAGASARLIIESMTAVARGAGLAPLVAPVRPSWKDRYPLTPIDRYARWERNDGMPFDPWLRVHVRLGATILRTDTRSLQIEAPVNDWEEWTGIAFPEDGDYVFPAGLAPLSVRDGVGSYWEPNVWMLHRV